MEDATEITPRCRKAMLTVRKRDDGWFRSHPRRKFRVRKSVAYERPGWGADDHKRFPYMIITIVDGHFKRWAVAGKRRPDDDDVFLDLLWREIEATDSDISPERHAEMLQIAGLSDG